MRISTKIVVVAALGGAVAAALIARRSEHSASSASPPASGPVASAQGGPGVSATVPADDRLPKLLDLGAGKCIPCKMMAPILEELKKEYAGRLDVEFIDVWQDPAAGKKHDIEMIPTQIFFDAEGVERYRHMGFLGKEQILAKCKELGIDLAAAERRRPCK